jgi:DNA replication protein DnaC
LKLSKVEKLEALEQELATLSKFTFDVSPYEYLSFTQKQALREDARRKWQTENPQEYARLRELEAQAAYLKAEIDADDRRGRKVGEAMESSGASARDLKALNALHTTPAILGVTEWNDSNKTFLVLTGVHNSGKSVAAAYAMLAHVKSLEEAYRGAVRSIRTVDIARWLLFRGDDVTERISNLRQVPFLVLDGLGSEFTNDGMRQTMFDIVDSRYGANRPTVLTSTLPLTAPKGVDSLESVYGNGVVSRLRREGKVVVLREEIDF